MYFLFDFGWYSIHLDTVCQEQEGELLNGQNLLSVTINSLFANRIEFIKNLFKKSVTRHAC